MKLNFLQLATIATSVFAVDPHAVVRESGIPEDEEPGNHIESAAGPRTGPLCPRWSPGAPTETGSPWFE